MTKSVKIAISIISGILIITLGLIYFSNYYRTEREINVVDLATFGLTLFLAWYVPNILEKKASGDRFEKEMLSRHIERLSNSFSIVQAIVLQSTTPRVMTSEQELQITSTLAEISRSINQFGKLLDECGYTKLKEDYELLIRKRIGFKQKVTGGNFQQLDFCYSPHEAAVISTSYSEIEMLCSLIVIRINRN